MENKQLNRLTIFCEKTWDNLSRPEQESYYDDTGVIGFIENCLPLLKINPDDVTIADMDHIVNRVMARIDESCCGRIYGSYIPTDDITVIFEEFRDDDGLTTRLVLRGFYYGESTEANNRDFYMDYEANFD